MAAPDVEQFPLADRRTGFGAPRAGPAALSPGWDEEPVRLAGITSRRQPAGSMGRSDGHPSLRLSLLGACLCAEHLQARAAVGLATQELAEMAFDPAVLGPRKSPSGMGVGLARL